jgi:hypothetical protein
MHHRIPSSEPLLVLGETDWRSRHQRFGLLPSDRLRHLYLIGQTGSGKSTLIQRLVVQDILSGRGVALLDPHGDLVQGVLPHVPPERTNDVVLIAPDDREFPVSFNIFRRGRELHPDPALLTAQVIILMKKMWADSWGPRLEHVLRSALLAIAQDQRATFVFLYRFLTDEAVRNPVVERLSDPVIRAFWQHEFPSYGKALQGEALSPVLNKLGAFVASPLTRNLLGQERSRVDIMAVLANQGILLADLATGRIGEDASHLFGGLIVTAIQLAAMERPRGGPVIYVYLDEFSHFTTGAITTVLSEARKFGMSLTLAHQYLSQVPDIIQDAIIGNVGTMLVFRLGGTDSIVLEREFAPVFTAYDLQNLPRSRVAARVMANGEVLKPFSARTLPPLPVPPGAERRIAAIREQSRQRFARPRAAVEAAIQDRFGA